MLKTERVKYYKVKDGQTLRQIAEYFSVSPFLLAKENGLAEEPFCGQVLSIPTERGNLYTIKEGDTKALLCGSEENFARKNGTDTFYIGMRIIL
jgi:LysM repeat protein